MTAQWKDESSWSRNDVERTPKTWCFATEGLRIIVTRHRDYAPTDWVLRVHPSGIVGEQVLPVDINDAKARALKIVREALERALEELP